MKSFTEFGFKKDIVNAVTKLNLKNAFEVQEQIIPATMSGKNIVFTSKTGSGKTLAYSLGFLGKINIKQDVQMIILVPTRELCIQVGKELKLICDKLSINVGVLYGGRDIKGDYRTLNRKNQILVGTPGRLILHINEKRIKPGDVKCLVFDESDQMLDQGFSKDCAYAKERVSKKCQLILSSATITEKVSDFIDNEIIDYELISIGELVPKNILQEKLFCDIEEKNDVLLNQLQKRKFKRVMIFANKKDRIYDITEFLKDNGYKAKAFSSDLEQSERQDHLNLFKKGKFQILVTTDVGSRGLHIEKVDIVVNYDIPTKNESYIHRIGRTGRIDKPGYSLAFVCPEDDDRFYNIEFEFDLKVAKIDKY